jgi:hypothetical protein
MIARNDIRKAIDETLDSHNQSARNRRCECGWRPIHPESRFGWAGIQHRQHLADVLSALFLTMEHRANE